MDEILIPLKDIKGMDYEPKNEAGVIILFTLTMRRLGFSGVIEAKRKFPDCIARKYGKRVPIEFEYRSKNFLAHKHDKTLGRKRCTIVCWEDNWADPPKNITILCLSKELGISNRIRLTFGKQPEHLSFLDKSKRKTFGWSMPASTKKGDLLLVWRAGKGQSRFKDILLVLKDAKPTKEFPGYGKCRIVCHLENAITLDDLRRHTELGSSAMVRSSFFLGANKELTPYWPYLYQLILDRNPGLQKILKIFTPGKFTI
jgi:hypothetical protein